MLRSGRVVLGGSELVVLGGAERLAAPKAAGKDVVDVDDVRASNRSPSFSRSTTTFKVKSTQARRLTTEVAGPPVMEGLQNKSLNP